MANENLDVNLLTAYFDTSREPYTTRSKEEALAVKNLLIRSKGGQKFNFGGPHGVLLATANESHSVECQAYNSFISFYKDDSIAKIGWSSFCSTEIGESSYQYKDDDIATSLTNREINCGNYNYSVIEYLTRLFYDAFPDNDNNQNGQNDVKFQLLRVLGSVTTESLKSLNADISPLEKASSDIRLAITSYLKKINFQRKKAVEILNQNETMGQDQEAPQIVFFAEGDAFKNIVPEIVDAMQKGMTKEGFLTEVAHSSRGEIVTSMVTMNEIIDTLNKRLKTAEAGAAEASLLPRYREVQIEFPRAQGYEDVWEMIEDLVAAINIIREQSMKLGLSPRSQEEYLQDILSKLSVSKGAIKTAKAKGNITYVTQSGSVKNKEDAFKEIDDILREALKIKDGDESKIQQSLSSQKKTSNVNYAEGITKEAEKENMTESLVATHKHIEEIIESSKVISDADKNKVIEYYNSLIPKINKRICEEIIPLKGEGEKSSAIDEEVLKFVTQIKKVASWAAVIGIINELEKEKNFSNNELIKRIQSKLSTLQSDVRNVITGGVKDSQLQGMLLEIAEGKRVKKDSKGNIKIIPLETPKEIEEYFLSKLRGHVSIIQGAIGEIYIPVLMSCAFSGGIKNSLNEQFMASQLGSFYGDTDKQLHVDTTAEFYKTDAKKNKVKQVYGIQSKVYSSNRIPFYEGTTLSFDHPTNGIKYMGSKQELAAFRYFLINDGILQPDSRVERDSLIQILYQRLDYFMRYADGAAKQEGVNGDTLKNNFYIINFNVIPASLVLLYIYNQIQDQWLKKTFNLDAIKPVNESVVKQEVQNKFEAKKTNQITPQTVYTEECLNLLKDEVAYFRGITVNFNDLGATINI